MYDFTVVMPTVLSRFGKGLGGYFTTCCFRFQIMGPLFFKKQVIGVLVPIDGFIGIGVDATKQLFEFVLFRGSGDGGLLGWIKRLWQLGRGRKCFDEFLGVEVVTTVARFHGAHPKQFFQALELPQRASRHVLDGVRKVQ